MVFDEDQDGILTELQYKGRVVKVIPVETGDEAIRIIDTSGITDVEYVVTVGRPVLARIEKQGTLGAFLFSLQLIGVMMIDSELPTE